MKKLTILVATLLYLCLPSVAFAYNLSKDPLSGACSAQGGAGASSAACGANGSDPISGSNGALGKATILLASVAGIAAVIVVIVGGFMYVTSNGDAKRAENGRNAIIGALVGLGIIAAAASIITFVINKTG